MTKAHSLISHDDHHLQLLPEGQTVALSLSFQGAKKTGSKKRSRGDPAHSTSALALEYHSRTITTPSPSTLAIPSASTQHPTTIPTILTIMQAVPQVLPNQPPKVLTSALSSAT